MAKYINSVNPNLAPGRTIVETTWHGIKSVLAYALDTVLTWHERSRQRHDLASLNARMLRDIGISRAEAEREYRKWFWQA